jgi:hypothetical protein
VAPPDPEPLRVHLGAGRDEVRVGERFALAFQRTLRIPEDGRVYPLPPGLGRLPVVPADEIAGPEAGALRSAGGFVIPLHQREALWLAFAAPSWHPHAVQVSAGSVNAVDGGPGDGALSSSPQNYVVAPNQPWLDGINAGAGHVRQFVALALSDPRTIEAQVRGRAEQGGLRVRIVPPRPGRFPESAPPETGPRRMRSGGAMGLGAGGRIAQRITPDPYGLDTWDEERAATVIVHILNSRAFEDASGRTPPPTPITAETYARHGLPWFALYDEDAGDVPASEVLGRVVPTGGRAEDEPGAEVPEDRVRTIRRPKPRGQRE